VKLWAPRRPAGDISARIAFIQSRIIAAALKSDRPFVPPLPLPVMSRFPIFRKRMARILAYGSRPELLKPAVARAKSHPTPGSG